MHKAQAMVEYVVVLAVLVVVATATGYVVKAAMKHAARAERLVSSEYP